MALVLRCVNVGGESYNGFRWPSSGAVAAPDWDPSPQCGGGLHGWLWGAGDVGSCAYADAADAWLVVDVPDGEWVDLGGKVKFPRGEVVFCGERAEAVARVQAAAPPGTPVVYGSAKAGAHGTATAGDRGCATAGEGGCASAGDGGSATAGYGGTATAGDGGTATAGTGGCVVLARPDGTLACASVGEGGLRPGVAYRLDENGAFVPA